MPGTSGGATVFDDLPESIITQEIFVRLSSKDVLRCRAVSKSWRGATSTKEFLLGHHRRQPSLPLVMFQGAINAFDIQEAPGKHRPVLGYDVRGHGSALKIHASCEGLLLVSSGKHCFSIINPTKRQWLALPVLTSACATIFGITGPSDKIAGMYPHPHHSGEYCVLFRKGECMDRNAGYYILTVGTSQKQKQKPKCIGPSAGSGLSMWKPPILLNGGLHWVTWCWNCPDDERLLVFDTARESFRWMSLPAAARGTPTLLDMNGMLGIWFLSKGIMKIWVLLDYEREIWSLNCEIELPMVKYRSNTLLSHKRDMVIYSVDSCLHQLHYDDNGKLLEKFQWETNTYRNIITEHWFQESLVRHTFFSMAKR